MKYIKWIVPGVLVLLLVGLLIVYFNLNSIVRRTVQTQATASLNLQTTVGGANVSLFGGRLGLSDIRVDSPQGFGAPNMFTLGGTRVAVRYRELRQDPIHIEQIVIDRPHLVVEQRDGRFNFNVLMDMESQAPPDDQPLRVIVRQLQVTDAHVSLRPGIPGLAQQFDVTIPSFDLENIGTGEGAENGAAIKEVVMLVVTTMAAKAAEAENLPRELQLLLQGNIESVAREMATKYGQQALGELQKNLPPEIGTAIGEVFGATTRPGEDPGKAIQEGLRGLIDRKDRDRDRPETQPR